MERIGTRESANSEVELIRDRGDGNGSSYGATDLVLRIDAEPSKSPQKPQDAARQSPSSAGTNPPSPKETITCNVCFESKDLLHIYTFQECYHSYCLDCLRDYLRNKILSNDCVDIHCMYPKCPTIIQYEEIKALAEPELFAKYESFSLQTALKSDSNVRWCPKPGCGVAMFGDEAHPEMRCSCGHVYCFKCGEDWHTGTCEEYQNWKKENGMVDKKFTAWRKENTRPCPNCKGPIQKDEGCNHMTCGNCKYEFCWLCGGHYTPNHYDLYNIFGCPGMQAGGWENTGLIKRTAIRIGVGLGLFFGTLLMVGYSIAMPGNVISVHGPPTLLRMLR